MPSSITATRCCARSPSSVSGRPIALLRLPRVACTASAPKCARRIAREHLLHRRLAVAADDDDHRDRELRAASARRAARAPPADRPPRRRSPASALARSAATSAAAAPRSNAAATKSWPSKRSPFSATNRSPGASARRVGRHAREAHVAADEASVHGAGGGRRIHHAPLHAASAAATTRASEKWWRTPLLLLVVLVALAGDQHHVARPRLGDRHPDRGGAVELHAPAPVGRCRIPLHHRVRDGRGVLGARVVAGDDDAVGEPPGHRAHLGPLALVAIAAAAEHADELAAGSDRRPQRRQHLRQRIRRMRVIDDHQRQRLRRPAAASGPAAARRARARAAPRRAARRSRAARPARRAGWPR